MLIAGGDGQYGSIAMGRLYRVGQSDVRHGNTAISP